MLLIALPRSTCPSKTRLLWIPRRGISWSDLPARFDLTVLVAHAPYNTAAGCEAVSFWERMHHLLAGPRLAGPLVVLTGANGSLNSITTPAIGEFCADPKNSAGSAFLLWQGLCLPGTFSDCHSGPSSTWTGPRGPQRHIDFMAVPESWRPASSSSVWVSFEAFQRREDHLPVVLHCSLQRQLTAAAYCVAPKRVAMRPDAALSPQHRDFLIQCFRATPAIPWHVDVDSHFEAWVQAGRAIWDTVVPPQESFAGLLALCRECPASPQAAAGSGHVPLADC